VPAFAMLATSADTFTLLRLGYPNVLISGPVSQAESTFQQMRPYLRVPVATWVPRETPRPPAGAFRSLLVRGADNMDASQQEDLARLINQSSGDVQIVSITSAPLYPLVTSGAFLQNLYYRLNVVLMEPDAELACS
jgi:hypothetical protein